MSHEHSTVWIFPSQVYALLRLACESPCARIHVERITMCYDSGSDAGQQHDRSPLPDAARWRRRHGPCSHRELIRVRVLRDVSISNYFSLPMSDRQRGLDSQNPDWEVNQFGWDGWGGRPVTIEPCFPGRRLLMLWNM